MQALLVAKLVEGDWLYEVKLDGYRALAFKDGKEVRP
jgi:ATP-dependent DNA ligase